MEIGVSAAEASGLNLVNAWIKALGPKVHGHSWSGTGIEGIPQAELFEDWQKIAVNGFAPVLRALPSLLRLRRKWIQWMQKPGPKILVLVDYPGFNLKLAQKARAFAIPVYYLSPPQVWIWKSNRIKQLRNVCCLCLFQHETDYLTQKGLIAHCVGHPIFQELESQRRTEFKPGSSLLLLPGSRPARLRQQLPVYLELWENAPASIKSLKPIVALPAVLGAMELGRISKSYGVEVLCEKDLRLDDIAMVWTQAGTATLRYAYLGIPMVLVARLSWISRFLVQRIRRRIRHLALHSQISGVALSPEVLLGVDHADQVYLDEVQRRVQFSQLQQFANDRQFSPVFSQEILNQIVLD